MLKVFLVEDEYVVREGIKNNIDWAKEGFIFSGDAADGEIAYKLIEKSQPDIIITDIKMPFMDGLELSRLVKSELPQSKIIILSGHEEFSYAQEAIKIGVDEYILKPISSVELVKVVKQVGQQIMNERIEAEHLKTYRNEMEENEAYIKRRFFNKIIEGSLSTAKILEKSKKLGFEMSAQYYQVILFKYNIRGQDEDYSNELLALNKQVNDLNEKYRDIIFFQGALEGNALLVKGSSLDSLKKVCKEYLTEMKVIMACYPEANYFGGVGIPVTRLTRLSESYESAALAFARRFIVEGNDIISNDEALELMHSDKHTLMNTLDLGSVDTKMAEVFLRKGELSEIDFFMQEFLKGIDEISKESLLLRQYMIMNVYFTALDFLKEIGKMEALTENLLAEAKSIEGMMIDLTKLKIFITHIFTICLKERDLLKKKHYYDIVGEAKQYIKEQYANEELTLNEVAAYVNISPSYFSTVFRREIGIGFIKYLTGVRMEKAKELLKSTDLRSSEISAEVGYKDPQYFSYIFKKENNCTPIQYRTSKDKR